VDRRLDNLSTVPDWLSDSICRAVTGDGDVRRKLYTDGEHAVFSFRRAVAITSSEPLDKAKPFSTAVDASGLQRPPSP
jgi:hypothetical protein